jgi:hypothetical protein
VVVVAGVVVVVLVVVVGAVVVVMDDGATFVLCTTAEDAGNAAEDKTGAILEPATCGFVEIGIGALVEIDTCAFVETGTTDPTPLISVSPGVDEAASVGLAGTVGGPGVEVC